jgi:hypothetical protein
MTPNNMKFSILILNITIVRIILSKTTYSITALSLMKLNRTTLQISNTPHNDS